MGVSPLFEICAADVAVVEAGSRVDNDEREMRSQEATDAGRVGVNASSIADRLERLMFAPVPAAASMSWPLAFSLWLVSGTATAGEPVTTLPPRTIPYGGDAVPEFSGSPMGVDHARSLRSPIGTGTRLVGIARPAQYAELRSAADAPILEVRVRTGDAVKAGEVLVRLDDRLPQSAVRVAQVAAARTGALSVASIRLQLAEQQLQRAVLALQRQAGSQFEVDEKTAARDQAQAQVTVEKESLARDRANLDRALAELSEFSIRAPFDGEVVQVHQKAGSTVDRSNPVITIANRRQLSVELHLPLTDFGAVKPGYTLTLHADAPVQCSLSARVTTVSSFVNSASRTFRVELEIDNADRQLPAGFTVRQGSAAVSSDELAIRRKSPSNRASR